MATILIVEDRPIDRRFLVTLLGYGGHRMLEASDGAEALAVAIAERPDLIITDLMMPTMDGFEFVKRLRADPTLAATPVVFYTASYLAREARALANAAGVSHVLGKPAEPQEILDVVGELLGTRASATPAASAGAGEAAPSPSPAPYLLTEQLSEKMAELEIVSLRLSAVIELIRDLVAQHDPLRMIETFCRGARRIVSARYAAVSILEDPSAWRDATAGGAGERPLVLRYFVTSGVDAEAAARLDVTGAQPAGQGLFDLRFVHGRPLRLRARAYARDDDARDREPAGAAPARQPAHAYLAVPIASAAQRYGLLYFTGRLGAEEFREEDEHIAATLAAQLAVTYENALRYEEIQRHAARLQRESEQRERVEAALRESNDTLRALVDASPLAIGVADLDGNVKLWNPAAERLYGWRAAEVLGGPPPMVPKDERQCEGFADLLRTMQTDTRSVPAEMTHVRKDGARLDVSSALALLCDAAGRPSGIVWISADISARKQAERALKDERAALTRRVEERTAELTAANVDLARATRLKDEFLAGMSHELRTPLNAILGLSAALQDGVYGAIAKRHHAILGTIEESGRHLLSLINDILDLSRIEAGKLTLNVGVVDVEPLCQVSLQFVRESAGKKHLRVTQNMDAAVPTVRADERRLKQILVNLLSNAVKFTPEGGQIGLDVIGDAADGVVRFTVWDTGIGIAEEDLSRLFKPFEQLESGLTRKYEGTGLGLSLVYRMVDMHGGKVTVESALGQGSRFVVALPWSAEPASSS